MKLRPITIMGALLVVGLAAAGLVAWRHRSGTVGAARPSTLPIRYAPAAGATAAAAMPAMASPTVSYVAAPGLSAPAGPVRAWHEQPVAVTSGQVATLAQALGLAAPVAASSGAWTVATPDRVLTVSRRSDGVWTWQVGPEPLRGPPVPAIAVAPRSPSSPAVASTTSLPSVPTSAPIPQPTTTGASLPAAASAPSTTAADPAGSPAAWARSILSRAGFDVAGWTASTVDSGGLNDWSSVTLAPTLDGIAVTGPGTTLELGPGDHVQAGEGSWGTWVPADAYPLMGTAAAIAHLNHGVGDPGNPVPDLAPVPAGGPSTAVSNGPSTRGSTGTVVASPPPTVDCAALAGADTSCGSWACPMVDGAAISCPAPGPWPTSTTMPAMDRSTAPPPVTQASITVRLDHVELVLAAMNGLDGSTWLVPAYLFGSSTSSGAWTVVAIDRQWFGTPTPSTDVTTETGGSDSAPGSSVTAVNPPEPPTTSPAPASRPSGVAAPVNAPVTTGPGD